MTSVRDLLTTLTRTDPTHPRLTWYGPGGERVELSGRVLGNWLTKAANLLVEEADAGPGTRVVLDLPAHWRAVVWAVGAWMCGAEVVLPAGGPERRVPPGLAGAVVITERPHAVIDAAGREGAAPDLVVAVALPALAMRFPRALPPRALDGAADLMTYPDVLGWLPPLDGAFSAIEGGVTHRELLAWACRVADAQEWPYPARVLVEVSDTRTALAMSLAAWAGGGSVVLVERGVPGPDRLAIVERTDVHAPGA